MPSRFVGFFTIPMMSHLPRVPEYQILLHAMPIYEFRRIHKHLLCPVYPILLLIEIMHADPDDSLSPVQLESGRNARPNHRALSQVRVPSAFP